MKTSQIDNQPDSITEAVRRIGAGIKAKVDQKNYLADPESYLNLFPYVPWSKEKQIMREIFDPDHKILLVRSGNNVGKTHTAAQAMLAWLDIYRYDAKVISTAKNFDAVRYMLWTRFRTMYNHIKDRFDFAPINQTDFAPDPENHPEWLAVGYNPKIEGEEATAFQGHHAKHILFVVDEAITTPSAIWKAIEGSLLSDGAKVLAIYNPTTTEGSEVYHMETDKRGKLITISCWDLFESPEYKANPGSYSMLVTPQGAQDLIDTYGREHPVVKARLDGDWVDNAQDTAINGGDLEKSAANWTDFDKKRKQDRPGVITRLLFGWDVAGEGSDNNSLSVVEVWEIPASKVGGESKPGQSEKKQKVLTGEVVRVWGSMDHAESLSWVYNHILEYRQRVIADNQRFAENNPDDAGMFDSLEPKCVLIPDAIGEGSHIPSIVREWDTEGLVGTIAFKAGEKAKKITEHKEIELLNKISEAWYRAGVILAGRIKEWPELYLKPHPKLFQQLRSRKREYGMKNKEPLVYYIEPKDDWKKRNRGSSPDEADSMLMALYGYFHGASGIVRMMSM